MEVREIIKKVQKLELKSKQKASNLLQGGYQSAFKGKGMIFSEVRPYVFGDDVRSIDWNKTAHFNEPYVKIFEEERSMTLLLAVDISESQNFGTRKQIKKQTTIEIAATLAFSAINGGDKVGLVLFSDKVELYIPAKKGRNHLLRIIREMVEFEPSSKKTNLNNAFDFLTKMIKQRALLFVISDFNDNNYQKKLSIASQKHYMNAFRIYDSLEESFPNLGIVKVTDSETGKTQWVNTSSQKVRNNFKKDYQSMVSYFEESIKKAGARSLQLRSDKEYFPQLFNYFRNS